MKTATKPANPKTNKSDKQCGPQPKAKPETVYSFITSKIFEMVNNGGPVPTVAIDKTTKKLVGHMMIDYFISGNELDSATVLMFSCKLKKQIVMELDFVDGSLLIKTDNSGDDEEQRYYMRDHNALIKGVAAEVIRCFTA